MVVVLVLPQGSSNVQQLHSYRLQTDHRSPPGFQDSNSIYYLSTWICKWDPRMFCNKVTSTDPINATLADNRVLPRWSNAWHLARGCNAKRPECIDLHFYSDWPSLHPPHPAHRSSKIRAEAEDSKPDCSPRCPHPPATDLSLQVCR